MLLNVLNMLIKVARFYEACALGVVMQQLLIVYINYLEQHKLQWAVEWRTNISRFFQSKDDKENFIQYLSLGTIIF